MKHPSLMDKTTYLLKISGSISSDKHKEFEQTIRFVFNMLPSGCVSSHLAADVFHPNQYHVFTKWVSGAQLANFRWSDEYNLIKGSFHTLGFIDDSFTAQLESAEAYRVFEDDA